MTGDAHKAAWANGVWMTRKGYLPHIHFPTNLIWQIGLIHLIGFINTITLSSTRARTRAIYKGVIAVVFSQKHAFRTNRAQRIVLKRRVNAEHGIRDGKTIDDFSKANQNPIDKQENKYYNATFI